MERRKGKGGERKGEERERKGREREGKGGKRKKGTEKQGGRRRAQKSARIEKTCEKGPNDIKRSHIELLASELLSPVQISRVNGRTLSGSAGSCKKHICSAN